MAGRTDKEREALALKCLGIEMAGGDVLGYLAKNGYPYSPRATWVNLQKDFLKRNDSNVTDGKPKENQKEELPMPKSKPRTEDPSKLAIEVAEAAISGEDPVDYLRMVGYVRPDLQWKKLRKILQEENIDLLEQADVAIIKQGAAENAQKAPSEPEKKKTKNSSSKEAEAPQAQNLDKMEGNLNKITSCCAPAKPSGVSLADFPEDEKLTKVEDLPKEMNETIQILNESAMAILAVAASAGGKFEKALSIQALNGKKIQYMHYTWYDAVTGSEKSLSMETEKWKQFAKEIPLALDALGIE